MSKWPDTGLTLFVLTPVFSRLLTLTIGFDFAGGRIGGLLVDQLRRLAAHDRRSKVALQPHPGDVEVECTTLMSGTCSTQRKA
jgi:hypothetical protein